MSYQAAEPHKQACLIQELIELNQLPRSEKTDIPFGQFLTLWAEFALKKLQDKAGPLVDLITPSVHTQLKNHLIQQFAIHCAPTLAEKLHIARIEGKLFGKTPEDRYIHYIQNLLPKPPFLKELFVEYPLFAKAVAIQILLFVNQFHEFLARFNQDRSDVEKAYGATGKITDLTLGLSDLHNGNRSVYKLEFENGTMLIYKPKPLGLDQAYNEFLAKLNRLGLHLPLKTHQVLNKGNYGWVEFVATIECQSIIEVERYFERFGMLIALMYLMEGTDWHYENMIASGENPVLIDLESLFHPIVKNTETNLLSDSVFRTAFLPIGEMGEQNRPDISPLSADEEQETMRASAVWEKVNTDEMQFIFVKRKVEHSIPRPKLGKKLISSIDHIPDLLRGFKTIYHLFSIRKEEILTLLSPLFHYPVRCIYRATQYYSFFLRRLSAPELMASAEKTETTFDLLTRFAPMKGYEQLKQIVEEEKIALSHLDIPFFMSLPSDTHLYLRDQILTKNCFQQPAMEKVIQRIQNLNEKDLAKQLFYIEHSLDFLKKPPPLQFAPHTPSVKIFKSSALLQTAEEIGRKILDSAISLPDGSLSWINLEYEPKLEKHLLRSLSPHFYSGEAGVALFLIALGKTQGQKILNRIKHPFYVDAEAAMSRVNLLGMNGLGGIIYALAAAGQILKEPSYTQDALHIASMIKKDRIYDDLHFNLTMGAAGLILSLLSLYEKSNEPSLLKTAEAAGNHLIYESKAEAVGCRWGDRRSIGFFNGNAGIAYTLFKLASITQAADLRNSFQNKALEAIRFERSQSPIWDQETSWIGLARLLGAKYYTDREIEQEIEFAEKATLESLFGLQDALSSGNFGRIAFLIARNPNNTSALSLTAELLERFQRTGTFNFYPNMGANLQPPSFLHGLSGIGYFLLKMIQKPPLPDLLFAE